MKSIIQFLNEAKLPETYKKNDIVSGITDGGMRVEGKFVGFETYKGKEYVKIQINKNTFYNILKDNALNKSLVERQEKLLHKTKKETSKEDRIYKLQTQLEKLEEQYDKLTCVGPDNDLEEWFAQNPKAAETGELPPEIQRKADSIQKKINAVNAELMELIPRKSYSSYEEYMQGIL